VRGTHLTHLLHAGALAEQQRRRLRHVQVVEAGAAVVGDDAHGADLSARERDELARHAAQVRARGACGRREAGREGEQQRAREREGEAGVLVSAEGKGSIACVRARAVAPAPHAPHSAYSPSVRPAAVSYTKCGSYVARHGVRATLLLARSTQTPPAAAGRRRTRARTGGSPASARRGRCAPHADHRP
jgi:hypothetical protein